MVQAGFATIYRDAGAEYGNIKDKLLAAEQRAKKQRIGMWKQSSSEYQSPGDFKRLNRLNAALNTLKNNGLIAENHSHDHRKVDFIWTNWNLSVLEANNEFWKHLVNNKFSFKILTFIERCHIPQ